MKQQRSDDAGASGEVSREFEDNPEYLRAILRDVVEVGASLRLHMDTEALLQRIVTISCQALRFRYAAIYLEDGIGSFRVAATSGVDAARADYLRCHPLPDSVVARIIDDCYRVSDSYFLPAEAPIWQDNAFARYFELSHLSSEPRVPCVRGDDVYAWCPEDLLLVPLVSGDEHLLGFLIPDAPLNGQRPTQVTMGLFELFANQAAVVIEGARLSGELRAALEQARESERAKNTFLLAASHELRTPLTAIQGYLELLGEYGETLDEASRTRFIQNARRGCDELVLLLGNVLDATHLDIEKLTMKSSPVNLARTTQTILDILEPIITREKRQVEQQIPADWLIQADELRMRQILLNLLGNALKYTPVGSRLALSVEVVAASDVWARCSRQRGLPEQARGGIAPYSILAVRDWGPGIAPAEQPLLFSKFTRLAAARKGSQRGAGLGLYLCRQLVEAMGGQIWVESSGIPGEGACFFVALPASPA